MCSTQEHVSIAEAAFRVGYNDASYVSRVFVTIAHMTPHDYKTRCKAANFDRNTRSNVAKWLWTADNVSAILYYARVISSLVKEKHRATPSPVRWNPVWIGGGCASGVGVERLEAWRRFLHISRWAPAHLIVASWLRST